MNAIRKILKNLQKYATTVTPVKNNVNAVTPLFPEKRSYEEADLDKETLESETGVNAATPQAIDTNECLKEFDDILEEMNKDVSKGASLDDIDDVLKDMAEEYPKDLMFEVPKFDLAEISAAFENLKNNDVDITNSLMSLDDSVVSFSDIYIANSNELIEVNDVISISSEDSSLEGCVKYIPTDNFGNIDFNSMDTEETKENIERSESIECKKLDNMYIGADKYLGIENQTEFQVPTNGVIDKTFELTDKTKEGIKSNSVECCEEANDLTIKDVVFIDDSDDGYQSSDFEFITEEEAKMDGLILNFKKKTYKRTSTKVNREKAIEIAVDQFSNAKKSLKRKKILRKSRNINRDPDWAPESDTDSISDDEFVPDDIECLSRNNTRSKNKNMSAKSPENTNTVTFSLRQIRIPPKRYNGIPRLINLQISSENLTSRNKTEYNDNVIKSNEKRDGSGRNIFRGFSNECRKELATMKMNENNLFKTEINELELAQVEYPNANFNIDLPEKVAESVKIIPGSKFMQVSGPDSNNMVIKTPNNIDTLESPEIKNLDPGSFHAQRHEENMIPESSFIPDSKNMIIQTNEMQDGPQQNNTAILKSPEKNNVDSGPCLSQIPERNIIPGPSNDNVPDPNNLNPGPSGIQKNPKLVNFGAGPSCKRKSSHIDEIEKWRMYQMRTRLNRPQFVVDYSYRDNHTIYQDNDLHQLFDPNRALLPTARSIRLLENKSTVCKNSMLVEYQGVGFNVPLRRDSGSEDEEVKREANECAQKILQMYPGQNNTRSRRRRF